MPPNDPNNQPVQPYYGPPAEPAAGQNPTVVPPAAPQTFAPQAATGPQTPEQQPYNPRDYGFIVDPPKTGRSLPGIPLTGGSALKRGLVFGGGIVLLIIIVVIFASLLKSPNKFTALTPVAQYQTELVRIASGGENSVSAQPLQNLAYNVSLSLTSDNQQLLTYLGKNGEKLDSKTLALKHSASTDTSLANAKANSTYDSTFAKIIQDDLAGYMQSLKAAYASNPGPNGRKLLNQEYLNAELLLTQSQQPQS